MSAREGTSTDEVTEELRQLGIPPLTDAGNAERFAAHGSAFIRFCHGWERWLIWDGTRWAVDAQREVYRIAVDCIRALKNAAPVLSTRAAAAVTSHALRSEKRERIEAMLALARALPPMPVVPDQLDRNPDLLNVANGILGLRTGNLQPHTPDHLLTKLAPVEYDPKAEAPTWRAFLERVQPDPEVRAYLQRAAGYSLTAHVGEHCMFFCWGRGRNGKSTLLEVVRTLMGEGEYAAVAAEDLFLASKHERHPTELADLRGARLVTSSEVGEGRAWNEARVKWITGGDTLKARVMRGDFFSFSPTHKLWVAANHKPRTRGTDTGFWRRVHLVPWTVEIPKAEEDTELPAKLRSELAGILAWAVEGCLEWRRGGLRPPAAVSAAVEDYRASEDLLAEFIGECCTVHPQAWARTPDLYAVYKSWADQNGERPWSAKALGSALEERGYPAGKSGSTRIRRGIGLKGHLREVGT